MEALYYQLYPITFHQFLPEPNIHQNKTEPLTWTPGEPQLPWN